MMDEKKILEALENLVSLKAEVELLTEQRKQRQAELLDQDEVYLGFKKLEEEKSEAYEQARLEVAKLGKDNDLNGKVATSNGSVSFSYKKAFVLKDEEKFKRYCKTRNLLEKVYKLELKKTEFSKIVNEADSEGITVDGVEAEEQVSISVSIKK